MKIVDIALKDMLRSFRSAFALVFMFVLPIMMAAIFYFAFGGLTNDEEAFAFPSTQVALVNLDSAGDLALGEQLAALLQNESLSDVMDVTVMNDEAAARQAVEKQDAGMAVIIPADFSDAVTNPGRHTEVVLVQDPTLTLGPAIVEAIISQFLDGFSGATIAAEVTAAQLAARGETVDPAAVQAATMEYVAWIQSAGQDGGLSIQQPPGKTQTTDEGSAIIADVMTGMLIFFAFFTGGSTAQTIITEDEEGTLSRLFTTPSPPATILGGKLAAVFATLMVQIVVTLVAGRLIFGIRWGNTLSILMAAVALVATAAGFGIFLMSLVKTSRQAGPVLGGVLTLTGMAGGLMTTGMPNLPEAFHTMNLFTPQGWAMRSFQTALYGGSPGEVLVPLLVSLGVGAIFFVVGVLFFRRRFA